MELTIKNLINLQDCDLRLEMINKKRVEVPSRIEVLEEDFKLLESQIDDELRESDLTKKLRRQLEQDIGDLDSRIEKSKIKLAGVKSNKEYSAALKEIEDLEREKAVSEEKLLQLMEETESVDEKASICKRKKETYKKRFEEERKKINDEMTELNKEIAKYESERSLICREIDENLLKSYDLIRTNKHGIAVASVIKGICQACNMGIPPQKFNELMRGDVLMSCPHCRRIIYWGEDVRFNDQASDDSEQMAEGI